jgi:hypothetical protein
MNVFECNTDYGDSGNFAPTFPSTTANVFYNNIQQHINSNVTWWFCPNATAEYWFNDIAYDLIPATAQTWDIAGTGTYASCTGGGPSGESGIGGQFIFNDTIVDGPTAFPCHGSGSDLSGGVYRTVVNMHLINTTFDALGCTGVSSTTASGGSNIIMSDATATSQGYTTGSSGTYTTNNCAHSTTTPCSPTAGTNTTVGAGSNLTATFCAALATFTETTLSTTAFSACKYSTTDGCAYNATTHAVSCPAQTTVARPSSGAWDAGAYEYSSGGVVRHRASVINR